MFVKGIKKQNPVCQGTIEECGTWLNKYSDNTINYSKYLSPDGKWSNRDCDKSGSPNPDLCIGNDLNPISPPTVQCLWDPDMQVIMDSSVACMKRNINECLIKSIPLINSPNINEECNGTTSICWNNELNSGQPLAINQTGYIDCYHDLSKINNYSQVKDWLSVFNTIGDSLENKENKRSYDKIMNTLCKKIITKNDGTNGTIMYTDTDDGIQCRKWAIKQDPSIIDKMGIEVCNIIPKSKECECLNRSQNPYYQDVARLGIPQKDSCWWKPCQNIDKAFVKSDLRLDLNGVTGCGEVCVQIIDAETKGDITIDKNDFIINCDDNENIIKKWIKDSKIEIVITLSITILFSFSILLYRQIKYRS